MRGSQERRSTGDNSLGTPYGFGVAALVSVVAAGAACGSRKSPGVLDAAEEHYDAVIEAAVERPPDVIKDLITHDGTDEVTRSCGGTVSSTGTTPLGAFGATDVSLEVGFICRSVSVLLTDKAAGTYVVFSLVPSSDGGAFSFLGQHRRDATASRIQGGPVFPTKAMVDVTVSDDPFTGSAPDAHPTGRLEATFTLSQDGFALTGSFSSPYCTTSECRL
jgi:hypothetical protein